MYRILQGSTGDGTRHQVRHSQVLHEKLCSGTMRQTGFHPLEPSQRSTSDGGQPSKRPMPTVSRAPSTSTQPERWAGQSGLTATAHVLLHLGLLRSPQPTIARRDAHPAAAESTCGEARQPGRARARQQPTRFAPPHLFCSGFFFILSLRGQNGRRGGGRPGHSRPPALAGRARPDAPDALPPAEPGPAEGEPLSPAVTAPPALTLVFQAGEELQLLLLVGAVHPAPPPPPPPTSGCPAPLRPT